MIPTVGFLLFAFAVLFILQKCLESVLIRLYAGKVFTNFVVTLNAIDPNEFACQCCDSPRSIRGILMREIFPLVKSCTFVHKKIAHMTLIWTLSLINSLSSSVNYAFQLWYQDYFWISVHKVQHNSQCLGKKPNSLVAKTNVK